MDSSRSGLLSTFLMTLPLIIVPAVALLRPPGTINGISTAALDASEDDDVDAIFDDFDGFENAPSKAFKEELSGKADSNSRELDDAFLFEDEHDHPVTVEEKRTGSADASPRIRPPSADPFIDHSDPGTPLDATKQTEVPKASYDPSDAEPAQSDAEKMVAQLKDLGALRTMWFRASESAPVGFAAFFRGETELTRIRFEAVGQTREECVQNVLDQVTRWQQQN